MSAKNTAGADVELVVADRCCVYLDGVLHDAGVRIAVAAADAASLLEQGVAYDPTAPTAPADVEEAPAD